MRISAFVALALTTAAALAPRPATAAYNLPWCAQYQDASVIFSCAFYTREQCMATVSGVGGFCMLNPRLRRSTAAYDEPRRTKRRHHTKDD